MARALLMLGPVVILILGLLSAPLLAKVTLTEHPGWYSISEFLGFRSLDIVTSELRFINIFTIAYAFCYYVKKEKWVKFLAFTLGGTALLGPIAIKNFNAVGWTIQNLSFTDQRIMFEYVVSVLFTSFFLTVDYIRSMEKDKSDAALDRFSSLYVSLPTLLALGATTPIYCALRFYGGTEEQLVAFYAGVAALLMLLSNITFSMVHMPGYAPSLNIVLAEKVEEVLGESKE
jgi:hypothetical protein